MKRLSLLTLALISCGTHGIVTGSETGTKTLRVLFLAANPTEIEVPEGLIPVEELRDRIASFVGSSFFQLSIKDEILKEVEVDTRLFDTLTVTKHIPYKTSLRDGLIHLEVDGKVRVRFHSRHRGLDYNAMVKNMFAYLENPSLSVPNVLKGDFDSLKIDGVDFIFGENIMSTILLNQAFSLDLLLYLLEGWNDFSEKHPELLDGILEEGARDVIRKLVFRKLTFTADKTLRTKEFRDALGREASARFGWPVDPAKIP